MRNVGDEVMVTVEEPECGVHLVTHLLRLWVFEVDIGGGQCWLDHLEAVSYQDAKERVIGQAMEWAKTVGVQRVVCKLVLVY